MRRKWTHLELHCQYQAYYICIISDNKQVQTDVYKPRREKDRHTDRTEKERKNSAPAPLHFKGLSPAAGCYCYKVQLRYLPPPTTYLPTWVVGVILQEEGARLLGVQKTKVWGSFSLKENEKKRKTIITKPGLGDLGDRHTEHMYNTDRTKPSPS